MGINMFEKGRDKWVQSHKELNIQFESLNQIGPKLIDNIISIIYVL